MKKFFFNFLKFSSHYFWLKIYRFLGRFYKKSYCVRIFFICEIFSSGLSPKAASAVVPSSSDQPSSSSSAVSGKTSQKVYMYKDSKGKLWFKPFVVK